MKRLGILIGIVVLQACGAANPAKDTDGRDILVIGASGRIGSVIATEAIGRGYAVTGMTRDVTKLADPIDGLNVVVGDVLDRRQMATLLPRYDAILVSVGGTPGDPDPKKYIAATAAEALIDVLTPLGDAGPRLIFVGNVFTLKQADGKTLVESGRVKRDHKNYAMFVGHQYALDAFRASSGVRWTVAAPPNGLRLKGRTGNVRWGGDTLLLDDDGQLSGISPEDFAFAVLEELERGVYVRERFTVAR